MADDLNILGGTKRRKTRQPPGDETSDLDRGNIRSTGVGLRDGEIEALDLIGGELGERLGSEPIARNALIRDAVRRFIFAYRSGEITPEELLGKFEVPKQPKPKYKP